MNYLEKLTTSAEQTGSIVCMGLDPVLDSIPVKYSNQFQGDTLEYFHMIFDEMVKQKVYPGAFKPNQGFFEKFDNNDSFKGSYTLSALIGVLKNKFPDIPIIFDSKRGDIGKSSENYAKSIFENWNADATTVHPYMGSDSVAPFIKFTDNGKGVYILNRTSNPGAKDFQNLIVQNGDSMMPLYMVVADKIVEWSKSNPGVGAVVGATSTKELEELTKWYAPNQIPMLIPGVGKQGGSASEVAEILRNTGYKMELARINSSSGITHPWGTADNAPKDWYKVCVDELRKMNEQIAYKKAA